MKKGKAAVLTAMLLCLFTAGTLVYGGGKQEAPAKAEVKKDPVTIRLGHAQPTTDVFHTASEKFAELCAAKSGGQIRVQVFPTGQLGSIRDMIEGLRIGTLQSVLDTPSRLEAYTELASIFNIPYLIENRSHGEKVWASEVGKKLFADLAQQSGIRIVAMGWRGARHMTTNKAIRTPDDLQGMKLRVPPYDIPVKTWKTLGANPTPMDWNEVYLALQQKTIDGQENPMTSNVSSKLYEVCSHLILTEHVKNFSSIMFSEKYYSGLTKEVKDVIDAAAVEAGKFQGDIIDKSEAALIEKFKAGGATIIQPDVAAFKNKLKTFVKDNYPQMESYVKTIENFK